MREKMLAAILAVVMIGSLLTGCGEGKKVEKIDENTAIITEVEDVGSAGETTEPVEESEETEETEETMETEEVVEEDYLAQNGLTITPQGTVDIKYATEANGNEEVVVSTDVSVKIVESDEEGYSDTIAEFIWNFYRIDTWWSASAYDRYTGCAISGGETKVFEANENGSKNQEVYIIDVNGKQYDCSYTIEQSVAQDQPIMTVRYIVHHPSEYDGVVFEFGGNFGDGDEDEGSDESESEESEDDDMLVPDERHLLFTASDN